MGRDEQRRGRPGDHLRQNRQVRDAAVLAKLTAREAYRLAEDVEDLSRRHGVDLGFGDIRALADQIVADRRS